MKILAMTVMMCAATVIGWGMSDARGFAANVFRLAALAILAAGYLVLLPLGAEMDPFKRGIRPAKGQTAMVATSAAGLVLFAWFLPFADRRSLLCFPDRNWLRMAALLLMTLGTVVRSAALFSLRAQYSAYLTIQQNHELIRTGLYRTIRHPFYLGQVLWVPGWALVFRSWLAVLILVASIFFVHARINEEEEILKGEFGTEYAAYQRESWRLLPGIY